MTFARNVFRISGIYGLVTLLPQFFLEEMIFTDNPPPLTHPEYFYGFLGVAVAWQIAFLVIAHNPPQFRLLMIPAIIEKFSWGIAAVFLFASNRVTTAVLAFGLLDVVLGILFIIAFMRLSGQKS